MSTKKNPEKSIFGLATMAIAAALLLCAIAASGQNIPNVPNVPIVPIPNSYTPEPVGIFPPTFYPASPPMGNNIPQQEPPSG